MFFQFSIFVGLILHATSNPLPGSESVVNVNLFEGDMKLNTQQESAFLSKNSRTGLLELIRRWPTTLEGFVEVPYRLDPSYSKFKV